MASHQWMRYTHLLVQSPICHRTVFSRSFYLNLNQRASVLGNNFYHIQHKSIKDRKLLPESNLSCDKSNSLVAINARNYTTFDKSNPCYKNGIFSKFSISSSLENPNFVKRFSTSFPRNADQDDKGKLKKRLSFDFLSLRSLMSTPTPFMVYGISGLIPFMSVPAYMYITSYCSTLALIQLVYGACILSFLGGVPWGKHLTLPDKATYITLGYSVFLPLVGWAGVLMHPNITAFPIVISGIAFAGYVDTQLMEYSDWFKNLRFLLTLLVTFSLFGTFLLSLNKESNREKKG